MRFSSQNAPDGFLGQRSAMKYNKRLLEGPSRRGSRALLAGLVLVGALAGCAAPSAPASDETATVESSNQDAADCLADAGWDVAYVRADASHVGTNITVAQQEEFQLAWSECVGTPPALSLPLPG